MRRLRGFVFFLTTTCTIVLTVVCLLWSIDLLGVPDFAAVAKWVKASVLGGRVFAVVVCGAVILLTLAYVFSALFAPSGDNFLRSKTKHGEIRINMSAVEETLQRAVKSLPDIHGVDISLRTDPALPDAPLVVRIDFSTWEDVSFKETGEKIEEIARARLEKIADLTQPVQFEIYLAKIVEKVEPRVDAKRVAKEEQNVLKEVFKGLEYPIETEQDK